MFNSFLFLIKLKIISLSSLLIIYWNVSLKCPGLTLKPPIYFYCQQSKIIYSGGSEVPGHPRPHNLTPPPPELSLNLLFPALYQVIIIPPQYVFFMNMKQIEDNSGQPLQHIKPWGRRNKRLVSPCPGQARNGKLICIEHPRNVKGLVWSFVLGGQDTCKSDLYLGLVSERKVRLVCSVQDCCTKLHCTELLSHWAAMTGN